MDKTRFPSDQEMGYIATSISVFNLKNSISFYWKTKHTHTHMYVCSKVAADAWLKDVRETQSFF